MVSAPHRPPPPRCSAERLSAPTRNSSPLLPQVVPLYPAEVPPSVVPPLLTAGALQLLGQSTGNEEKRLWASLGDSWNIPRYREGKWTGCRVRPRQRGSALLPSCQAQLARRRPAVRPRVLRRLAATCPRPAALSEPQLRRVRRGRRPALPAGPPGAGAGDARPHPPPTHGRGRIPNQLTPFPAVPAPSDSLVFYDLLQPARDQQPPR